MTRSTRVRTRSPAGAAAARSPGPPEGRLIERFAPEAEIAERHETVVGAPADLVLRVAENFDLLSIRPIRFIFWLRARIMGAPPPERDDLRGLVAATRRMGWRELARRPGREVVMGAAVQPWLAEPVFEPVPPERFLAYDEPDHVKILWTLEADPLGPGGARFRTETRVQPTDQAARKKFRRYWRLAGAGIVLIRLLVLPAVRREAERRWREIGSTAKVRDRRSDTGEGGVVPLLDRFLPTFEARVVRETVVDAPADVTYASIAETNLLDPVVRSLFAVRELPARLLARLRGKRIPTPPRSVTVADFLRPGTGMVRLGERPGAEVVVGSVGRFWERDYGHREVSARDFGSFREPGFAKLAMGLRVRPTEDGKSVLRYEARTATTDAEARRRFGRYWRLIRPGVWLVMARAVALIRKEAEARARRSAGVS